MMKPLKHFIGNLNFGLFLLGALASGFGVVGAFILLGAIRAAS